MHDKCEGMVLNGFQSNELLEHSLEVKKVKIHALTIFLHIFLSLTGVG